MLSKKLQKTANTIAEFFGVFTKQYFNYECRDDQLLLAEQIFYYFLRRKRHTINVSLCRQVGKTETIVYALLYILLYFENVIGERIRVCITAPEKGTSTEFFDRLKLACKDYDINLEQSNNDLILFKTGNRVDKFGLFKAYAKREDKKTTREGRTFHIVVRDEKHMGDDYIYSDEIAPAMTTTGGLELLIGNGGFKNCRAKQISDMFPDKTQILQTKGSITNFEINFDQMKALMKEAYEKTENEMFLRWIDSQDAYVEEHGIDSELVQKNLYNQWFTEYSNFIDINRLRELAREDNVPLYSTVIHLGLDLAKSQDETVLTFTDDQSNVREWQIFKGEYTQQVEDIYNALMEWKQGTTFEYEYLFVDSTGVGDPVRQMLKERLNGLVIVRGIVFSAKEKDILARKAMKAFSAKEKRFSYPKNHILTPKFEKQMIDLLKEFREDGKVNYKHPDVQGARDDFADSTFLSMYKIQSLNSTQAFDSNTIDVL